MTGDPTFSATAGYPLNHKWNGEESQEQGTCSMYFALWSVTLKVRTYSKGAASNGKDKATTHRDQHDADKAQRAAAICSHYTPRWLSCILQPQMECEEMRLYACWGTSG